MIDFTKHFERVYVINLDRRPDRYESFKQELAKHNIVDVERFSAVDGTTILANNIPLLAGEIGVLESHLAIIKKCKEDGIKNVLILEDDVYFTPEVNNLDEYLNSVPNDWDFIYFGGNHVYGTPPELVNEKIIKLNFTVALQCVAINHTMFDIIEAILPKMRKQVDAYYADLHKTFNAYGFYPNMAKQTAGFSDIQNRNVDYTNFFRDEK
ncbi:MAG: glycosyltransferase family 25 protein [Spirochaetes bacterium]|nr:MAG: glycosyltransferase family 25 protein [Spirochaetota bacterium]